MYKKSARCQKKFEIEIIIWKINMDTSRKNSLEFFLGVFYYQSPKGSEVGKLGLEHSAFGGFPIFHKNNHFRHI